MYLFPDKPPDTHARHQATATTRARVYTTGRVCHYLMCDAARRCPLLQPLTRKQHHTENNTTALARSHFQARPLSHAPAAAAVVIENDVGKKRPSLSGHVECQRGHTSTGLACTAAPVWLSGGRSHIY